MADEHIHHSMQDQRFYIAMDGSECEMTYLMEGENVINYHHTYVPDELRGHGLASKIVRHGLDYAREKGYKVKPQCPFVRSYIQKHEEYQDLLA